MSDPSLSTILQAASNICGGLEYEQAGRIIQTLNLEGAVPEGKDLQDFFPEGGIPPIRPDTLGAAYTMEVLWQRPQAAPDIIWLALGKKPAVSLPRFSRICQDAEIELDFARINWAIGSLKKSPGRRTMLPHSNLV